MVHGSVGLTLKKLCGEFVCPEYYLCQHHDLQCYPCQSYCNQTSHNFDSNLCERQCQDYIHDYIKHYVKAGEIESSLQELEILKFMMIFILVLMVVGLILISIMTALIWNRRKKTQKTENGSKHSRLKKKIASFKVRDNAVSTVSETVDKQGIEPAIMAAEANRMTASSSNKLPCEDVTLETQNFTGYDNLGMWKVSPESCSKL